MEETLGGNKRYYSWKMRSCNMLVCISEMELGGHISAAGFE